MDVFRVITGGEPPSADVRRNVESTLGTEAFDIYGASESIVVSLERGDFDGIYLFDDLKSPRERPSSSTSKRK